MARVMLARTGQACFRGIDALDGARNGATCAFEPLAAARHLLRSGHQVVIVGRVIGSVPEGAEHIDPADHAGYSQFTRDTSAREHTAWLEEVKERVGAFRPEVFLNFPSTCKTACWAGNSTGMTVMEFAGQNAAPALYSAWKLGLPRIVCVQDVRCIPAERELATDWPGFAPCAVLSQKRHTREQQIQGVKFRITEVHGRSETWCTEPWPDWTSWTPTVDPRPFLIQIMQHCHVADGYCSARRRKVFAALRMDQPLQWDRGSVTWDLVGRGWEAVGATGAEVHQRDMPRTMRRAWMQLLVPPDGTGHLTAKVAMAAASGSAPIALHFDHLGMVYDPDGVYIPLTSAWRVRSREELARLVTTVSLQDVQEQADRVWELAKPNFRVLNACIEGVVHMLHLSDPDGWREAFGGYECLKRSDRIRALLARDGAR